MTQIAVFRSIRAGHLALLGLAALFATMLMAAPLQAIDVYRYSPASSVTIEAGESITFNIGADDPYGLDFAEWYLGSTYMAHHSMSGYYDEDSWTRSFSSSGSYSVYAYVYNDSGSSDFTWWSITVEDGPPDLVVQNPDGPSSAAPGESISVSCRVRNQGDGPAGSCRVGYYISTSPYGHEDRLDYDSVSSLDAGEYSNESESITLPSGLSAGTWYINFYADYRDDVDESNENNNIHYHEIEITGTPDLYVSSSEAPSTVYPGQSVSLSCAVSNYGDASSGSCRVGYYLASSSGGTTTYLDYDSVSSLDVGEHSSESETVTIPLDTPTGTRYFTFYADYQDVVDESSESNNKASRAVTVADPMEVHAYSPSSPVAINAGESITFEGAASDALGLDFFEWYVGSSFQVNHSASGYYDEDSWSHTFSSSGSYTVSFYAYNVVGHAEYVQWQVNVGAALPDLYSGEPQLPEFVYPGETIDCMVEIQNLGAGSAGASYTCFFLNQTPYSIGGELQQFYTPAVAAESSINLFCSPSVPGDQEPGEYYLNSFCDYTGIVGESNESNNMHYAEIEVRRPVQVYAYSPATELQAEVGSTVTFNAGMDDSYGLDFSEWYIGGDFLVNHSLSGYYDEDSYAIEFSDEGSYVISCYAYNVDGRSSFVQWQVEVGEMEPVEELFFDDFSYSSNDDPQLSAFGWRITHGTASPPYGSYYDRDQVEFREQDEQEVLTLHASNSGSFESMTQAHIGTQESMFFEGTYAARVRFSDSPVSWEDGNVQTFYTITSLEFPNDPDYSECDFEYLPYDQWGGPLDHDRSLYMTTWETYVADPWEANNTHSEVEESFADWHIYVIQVMGGSTVNYFVDGELVASHTYSDSGDTVYPETPMYIGFNHWFATDTAGSGLGSSTEFRDHSYDIDWFYHAKDRSLSLSAIEQQVSMLRGEGWERYNSMEGNSPLMADFTATPLSGTAPLQVDFSDASTGSPQYWHWDFNDDGSVDSYEANPVFVFEEAGTYTVSMTVSRGEISDTITREAYITVSAPNLPPMPVNDLSIESMPPNEVLLSWSAVEEDTGGNPLPSVVYDIYRSSDALFTPNPACFWASVTSLQYVDEYSSNDTALYYKVVARIGALGD